jgi:hypothetical protein
LEWLKSASVAKIEMNLLKKIERSRINMRPLPMEGFSDLVDRLVGVLSKEAVRVRRNRRRALNKIDTASASKYEWSTDPRHARRVYV